MKTFAWEGDRMREDRKAREGLPRRSGQGPRTVSRTGWTRAGAWVVVLLWSWALFPCAAAAGSLAGFTWSRAQDLITVAGQARAVRLITGRVVLAEVSPAGMRNLRASGHAPFLTHAADGTGQYYVVRREDFPLPGDPAPVYADPAGWVLCYLRPEQVAQAWPRFLCELPAQYSLKGWLTPGGSAKPATALGAASAHSVSSVEQLLDQVDLNRVRRDLLTLALHDPQGTSAYDNLRSRFAVNPQIHEATEYIRSQLCAALGGDQVHVEQFQISADRLSRHLRGKVGEGGVDLTAYNVVGELPGTDPEAGCYIICGHYDATAVRTPDWNWRTDPAPGADDNGTGASLVMEAARVLSTRRFPWTIRFIAFSGEELGLLGSRAYAASAAQRNDEILGVLNFDMFGYNDLVDRVQLATNTASDWLARLMVDCNARYDLGLDLDVLVDDAATQSDHSSFWLHGYDAILAIENYLPTDPHHYAVQQGLYRVNRANHSVRDVPDSLNWNLVYKTVRLAVATLGQYSEPEGNPDLAVFTGDLEQGPAGLVLPVSNLGTGSVDVPFTVEVASCDADSSHCRTFFSAEYSGGIAPGGRASIPVPWDRLGDAVFHVDVDPERRVAETSRENNQRFQRLYVQPRERIVVYPNPFRPERDGKLVFTGLPWHAQVRIFAPGGRLVWRAREDDSRQRHLAPAAQEVWWLGVNGSGGDDRSAPLVASGVYVYTISTEDGRLLARDKIAVLR